MSLESSELLGTLDLSADHPIVHSGEPSIRKCYQLRYRFRWFPSKGAHLVLLWTLLVSIGFGSLDNLFTLFLKIFGHNFNAVSYVLFLPYIPWFVFALLSGWIADAKCGNHTMVRTGVLMYLVASVMVCVLQLAISHPIDEEHRTVLGVSEIIHTIIHLIGFAGRAMILVTSVQLGLEQMPDASCIEITSFITWFVASLYAGNWINSLLYRLVTDCWPLISSTNSEQIFSLVPVICGSIVLCSDFLLSKKWLIREGVCSQSSKTILQVLKFAKQHKAPLNRSALTYWENEIPSRIDLGKSKYGGPFSTEEVENVKTVLRMLALSVSYGFIFTSFYFFQQFVYVKDFDATVLASHNCSTVVIRSFSYETSMLVVICIAVYEFAIYPFAVPIIPSSLKRIGFTSMLTTVVNMIALAFSIIDYNFEKTDPHDTNWFWIVQSVISAPLKIILLTSAIEFVCAQSPHHMKGLMIGYMWSNYYISNILANILAGVLHTRCDGPFCPIIYSSIATVWSIVGLVFFCLLARWYKRRVRDDIATPHRWVEDAYYRYLASDTHS